MKRYILILLSAVMPVFCASAQKVTFVPQWTAQAQFAGFYMALEKGYYEAEGLDVTIDHIGVNSTVSVADKLYSGEAQIVGQQLVQSIIARSDGRKIVNVLQLTQESGLCCVSHDSLSRWSDLGGKKVGRWKSGYSEICEMMESREGININWTPCIDATNLFIYDAVDAALCYSYNELIELELAMGDIPRSNIFTSEDMGFNFPDDGLYVTEDYYNDNKDTIDKFIRATKKGWSYAEDHLDETIDLCMSYCKKCHVITTRALQKRMFLEYRHLMADPETWDVNYAKVSEESYLKLVNALYASGHIIVKPKYTDLIK